MIEVMHHSIDHYTFFHQCSVTVPELQCFQAMKRNLVYPHYAWIIYSFHPDKWWTEEVAKEHLEECSDQKLEEFLLKSHALLIHFIPEPDDLGHLTAAGLV